MLDRQTKDAGTPGAGAGVETVRGAGPLVWPFGLDDLTHHVVAVVGERAAAQAAVAALRRAGWDGSDICHHTAAHVLVVYAPSAYQVHRAHLILAGHGARGMRHYGDGVITDLPVFRRVAR